MWDLGLLMSIYYDALRRFYEIKGRENDFFGNKRILFAKEKEYNAALQLSFANLKAYLWVLRGKNIDGKMFYEAILERFWDIMEKRLGKNGGISNENVNDILFFYKVFIGFEFKDERFEGLMKEILINGKGVSINDFTEIYLTYFRKMNFSFPEIFQKFIESFEEKIVQNKEIAINSHSEPHYLYLPIEYLSGVLGGKLEISKKLMKSDAFISNRNLLDVYWMLSRNFNPKMSGFLENLEKKLEGLLESFLFKDLTLMLIAKIYHNLRKKGGEKVKIEDYMDILKIISAKINNEEENIWEILNIKTISGNIFLSLKFLTACGYSDVIEELFDEEIMLFLGKQWLSATRVRKTSNSEKIIR